MKKDLPSRTRKRAPRFCLPDQNAQKVCLRDLLTALPDDGYVLLFFYPRDNTPGCTTEAIGFSTLKRRLANRDVTVVGISKLTSASKKRFADKHNLRITLLADEDHTVAQKYGVWREKNMYGKKVHGIARESFLIDKSGIIVHHFQKVTPADHPKEALALIDTLRKSTDK